MSRGRFVSDSKVNPTLLPFHKKIISLNEVASITSGAGTVDSGGVAIHTFPLGRILILGLAFEGRLVGGTELPVNWTGDLSIGSRVSAANTVLGGVAADVVASETTGIATNRIIAGVEFETQPAFSGTIWNGPNTSTPLSLYFNVSSDVGQASAATTVTIQGKLAVAWTAMS